MLVPNYLKEHLMKQWQRALHVLMKTWTTVEVAEDFWIFQNKEKKMFVVFEWDTKEFNFIPNYDYRR